MCCAACNYMALADPTEPASSTTDVASGVKSVLGFVLQSGPPLLPACALPCMACCRAGRSALPL